jgi:DHA2 family multidrug resistance protein
VGWGTLARQPLIDLRPLGERNFGLGLVVKALFSVDLFVLVALLSSYMIGARGYQWWQGGLVFLPALVAMGAAMLAGARFGRDRDRKLRIFAGLAVMSAVTWRLGAVDLYTSKVWIAGWLAVWGAGAGLAIGPTMLTVFAGLPPDTLAHAAGVFNIFRSLPVFAVGSLLVVLLTVRQDTHFDRLRLRITHDRPLVAATRANVARHVAARGGGAASAAQSRALLARWVRANAGAFALGDVLRVLALVTASSLLLVPALRPPPERASPRDADRPPA